MLFNSKSFEERFWQDPKRVEGRRMCRKCFEKNLQGNSIPLPYFPLNNMVAVSQTSFSDAFSWMKSFVFWSRFHRSLFLGVKLTITQHWFRYQNQCLVHWRKYAALGGDELNAAVCSVSTRIKEISYQISAKKSIRTQGCIYTPLIETWSYIYHVTNLQINERKD